MKHRLLLFLVVPYYALAGSLEKGFEALKAYNYFEAKKNFTKALKSDVAGAAYGLSTIFYKNDNPFHNIDSAYSYIVLSEQGFKHVLAKDMTALAELGVTHTAIDKLKEDITLLAFDRAKKINTEEELTHFIKQFSHPSIDKEAKKYKAALAFRNTQKQNTPAAYNDFITNYPAADELNEAKKLYDLTLFHVAVKENTLTGYETFVKHYPASAHKAQAEDSVFAFSTRNKSIDEYYFFLKKYPSNHCVKTVWEIMYQLYALDFSVEKIQKFINAFPDYPNKIQAYADLQRAGMPLLPASQNNQYGYVNSTGAVVIPFKYDWADAFHEGAAIVTLHEKSGYINKSGTTIFPCELEEAAPFNKGVAVAKKNGKYGILHKTGKIILPFEYEDIIGNEPSNEAIFIALKEKTYFYYTIAGTLLFTGNYELAGTFVSGKAYFVQEGKYGFIHSTGKVIIPPQYDWVENFKHNGLARVKQLEKFGVMDTTGKMILPCEYTAIDELTGNYVRVAKDKKFGFANKQGQLIIPLKYDYSPELSASKGFVNGLAKVELAKKRGLIDTTGKFILPCEYEDVGSFKEDLCPVKNKKWGFVDKNKKLIIPFQYDYASGFSYGLARVKQKDKVGFINHAGKVIVPAQYDEASDFNKGFSIITQSGLKGLIDASGKVIIPCEMAEIKEVEDQLFYLEKNKKMAYYNPALQKQIWAEQGF
jgi:hypothetical protein